MLSRTMNYWGVVQGTKIICTVFAVCLIQVSEAAQLVSQNSTETAETTETADNQSVDKSSNDKPDWDNFVPPQDKEFDWLQLTSGEWLKGELKVLYNFSLEFDSDELDLLKFDWEDIKQIRTADPQSVRIEKEDSDEEPITVIGVLHLTDGKLLVISEEKTLEFNRSQIVSIAQGATKEIDLWTGKVSLGINIREGNSDLTDVSLIANVKRRAAESRFVSDYVGNYSEAEGVETSNNHRINAYFDKFRSSRFFWRVMFGEYLRDTFKNIDRQVTVGTGFGYHIVRTPETEWVVSGGLGVLFKKYTSISEGEDNEKTSPSLALGTKYDTELTDWMDYIFDFSIQVVDEDSGRYLTHFITTLESDLTNDLDLDVSFVWDRVQDPQAESDGTKPEKNDYQLIVGVGYEF